MQYIDLLHGLGLGSGTNTGHRQAHIDGRTHSFVEKLSLQENLSVRDGNDICRDVSRHISSLGLNYGKCSHRTALVSLIHFGSSLEQTRMEVEDIA
jgi:hypothetical protein